jgi:hypothetical protein
MLFLSRDEVQELTGYKRAADQIRWLARARLPHAVNAAGRPVVSKAAAETMLGSPGNAVSARPEPNWAAIGA